MIPRNQEACGKNEIEVCEHHNEINCEGIKLILLCKDPVKLHHRLKRVSNKFPNRLEFSTSEGSLIVAIPAEVSLVMSSRFQVSP
jgi:hypothetical protein